MSLRVLGGATLASLVAVFAWYSATHSVDFPIYHSVGSQILDGQFDLYAGTDSPGHYYRYAPAIAFLLTPLAWLPLPAAAFVFFCLKIVAFVYIGRVVARHAGVPARSTTLLLASLLVVGGYLVEEFRNGNIHFLIVALMVLAFDAAERGRNKVAGAALAVAIAAKLTPALLLAYFAMRRRFAVCAATFAALAILWVLPVPATGVEVNNRLTRDFMQSARQMTDAPGNYSLRGAVFRYLTWDDSADPRSPRPSIAALSDRTATAIWIVLLIAGGAWLAAVLWRAPSSPPHPAHSASAYSAHSAQSPILEFSMVLVAMLLASPHSQRQYFSVLLVPVLALLGMSVANPGKARDLSVRAALIATAAAGTFLPLILGSRRLAVIYEASSPYFFATLITFVALLALTARLEAPVQVPRATPARAESAIHAWIVAATVCAAVFVFRFLHIQFTDDHFDRISRGRQIGAWGEVPFRDFFDPGFFLTSYSSAAVQMLFGHNLLSEALLTIAFVAVGSAIAMVLAHRLSRSWRVSAIATAVGVAMLPRLYNYDKVLFLPLGVLACWSYSAKPDRRRLLALAAVMTVAAMYRPDNGLYIAAGAAATMLAVHWRTWGLMLTRAATLVAFVLACSMPVLLFIQATAGLPEAARQVLEYADREGRRTEIFSAPGFSIDRSAPVRLLGAPVNVRWRSDVDDAQREELEGTFHLERGEFAGGRTWRYSLTDVSGPNIDAIVHHRAVEDTHGLLTPDGTYGAEAAVSVLPGVMTQANAAVWLYYTLMVLPVLAIVLGCRVRDAGTRAALVSCGAVLLTAHLFLLRSPLEARLGDIAAPAVPLAAWVGATAWQTRRKGPTAAIAATAAVVCVIVSIAAVTVLAWPTLGLPIDRNSLANLAASPPPITAMPSGRTAGVVEYLRECTAPADRVFTTWFAPELPFFSGRAFAGGMNVAFGGHWSGPRDAQTILERLERQQPPIVVTEARSYFEFQADFPGIDQYLQTAYAAVAEHTLGSAESTYRILMRRNITPSGVDSRWGLPCPR